MKSSVHPVQALCSRDGVLTRDAALSMRDPSPAALHPRDRGPRRQALPHGDERGPRADPGEVQHHHGQRAGAAPGQQHGRGLPHGLHGAGRYRGARAG